MEDNPLMKEMKNKYDRIREMGIDPHPYRYEVTHHAKDILEKYGSLDAGAKTDDMVSVAGRMMSCRMMGKAAFATLQDQSGRIQCYFRKDDVGDDPYKLFKMLDIGDILGVRGKVFKSMKGEVTVHVDAFELLSKALRPLPEKFHGIKDPELRYRKRYIDMIMNPGVKDIFVKRAKIYKEIRRFLDERGYIEVQTPILQTQYGGANARPFVTRINAWNMPMYLRIAYELHLKRLLVGGFEKVYDLSSCFRNEGVDKTHNPEFAMMEIQTAYADYNDVMKIVEELWEHVAKQVNGTTVIDYGENKIDLKAPWERLSMVDAIKKYAGIDVGQMKDPELAKLIKDKGVEPKSGRGLLISQVFEEYCEEKLIQPIHITDHPQETCPLAKSHRKDPALIERCESFINTWEVGNYYSELTDAQAQRKHFEEQVRQGRGGDDEAHPMDEDYIEALEYGLPPNAGIGIGIERMIMLLTGSDSIREVLLFPTMKPN